MERLSAYERQALDEIERWKHPRPGRLGALWQRVNRPFDEATGRALGTGLGAQAVQVVQEVVEVLNEGASATVSRAAVLRQLQASGPASLADLQHIADLDLEVVDGAVASLGPKYRALAVAEGAGSGLLGGLAIVADIGLVVGLALRAANEYATYFGFDVGAPGERLFVVRLLAAASSPNPEARAAAIGELGSLAADLQASDGWRQPSAEAAIGVTRKLAEVVAVRLLKGKLGQAIPLAGAVVAGGYNAWFVGHVTEMAHQLYRERFLLRKHGEGVAASADE